MRLVGSSSRVVLSGLATSLALVLLAAPSVRSGASLAHAAQSLVDGAWDGWSPAAPETPPPTRYAPNDGLSTITTWRSSLGEFAERDRLNPPVPGGIVFVGSSSLRLWDGLAADFPSMNVVNRGFGGSSMADCARYADRLVLPYRPRGVVVYAGDNDLAGGASPQDVLDAYVSLVQQVHAQLPQTRIAFVSIKPSLARLALLPTIVRANELVRTYSRTDASLDYIDIHSRMLDADGHPRAELFRADGLHPSAAGYAVWQAAIAEHLR